MNKKEELKQLRNQLNNIKKDGEYNNVKPEPVLIPDNEAEKLIEEIEESGRKIVKNPQSGFIGLFGIVSISTAIIIAMVAYTLLTS